MKFQKWRQNEKLAVIAILFTLVMGGVAYGGAPDYSAWEDYKYDSPASVSPVLRKYLMAFGAQMAAGGAKDTADQVATAQLHTDNRNIGNQAIGVAGGERNMNSHVATNTLMPAQGGQAVGDLIKARDAATQLYAISDDLAKYMTVAIMSYYLNMTPEQARESLVAEATQLGYMAPDPQMSKNNMPSFIANAYASSGSGIDATPALPGGGRGRAGKANFNGNYGVSCNPPQDDPSKQVCGGLIGAKAQVVDCMFPMDQSTPTATTLPLKIHRLADEHKCGGPLYKNMKEIAETSITAQGGSSDNSPFNFFISTAYARVTSNATLSSITGAKANAEKQACSTAKQVHEGNNTCSANNGQASALQASLFGQSARCNSVDKNAYNANTTTRNRTDIVPDIENGCSQSPKEYLDTY